MLPTFTAWQSGHDGAEGEDQTQAGFRLKEIILCDILFKAIMTILKTMYNFKIKIEHLMHSTQWLDMNRSIGWHTTICSAYIRLKFCLSSFPFLKSLKSTYFAWEGNNFKVSAGTTKVMPFFEDLHKLFQNTPQSNLCGPLSAKAFVHCKIQVQMLNISVKFEGLRH